MNFIFDYRLKVFCCVLAVLVLAGCATSTSLTVRRAPEIDLGQTRYVRVEPFVITGSLNLKQYQEETFIDVIIDILSDRNDELSRTNSDMSRLHQRELVNELARDGYYTLTMGHDFEASLGGTITYSIKDKYDLEKRTDPHGKEYLTNRLERTINCVVDLMVMDRHLDVIGSSRFQLERTVEAESPDRYDLFQDIINWEEFLLETLRATYPLTIQKIAPYDTVEKRVFAKGESKLFREANKAAKHNDWDRALALWRQAEHGGSTLDRGASLYNQAIYAEKEDRLEDALELYQKAYDLTENVKWFPAISHTRQRLDEQERLNNNNSLD
ncbi:tetratricopeptide repeat protein [bacterium]|nr:tetratricopeptide repeat protein [bacterium]